MKRLAASLAILAILALSARAQPAPGSFLADMELSGPLTPEQAASLGISKDARTFRLSQVKAEFLLLEIFSMYCPHCQREASRVNELDAALRSSPWAGRILLLGLGAGNSSFEVDVFREQYKIPFPLFADPDFTMHKALGQVGTPCFILVGLPGDERGLPVLDSLTGGFGDTKAFLDRLATAAGLKK
ncbi:MAG: peroxiredoxin family protein [Desulfovibrio aminophilus]|jgi:peroxiredoxin|uniref:peroxiredoxin family protein n=1 Tax=Desulfovibrio aminophilus TaxID=81425 RepID=UPI0003F65465|nr:TlpA disulfide reductase family protein [Desulfovibrio aminophilus]MDY0305243.1 TlpA disulfide reductase family protein [Desulfovibrionaceae bacterium]